MQGRGGRGRGRGWGRGFLGRGEGGRHGGGFMGEGPSPPHHLDGGFEGNMMNGGANMGNGMGICMGMGMGMNNAMGEQHMRPAPPPRQLPPLMQGPGSGQPPGPGMPLMPPEGPNPQRGGQVSMGMPMFPGGPQAPPRPPPPPLGGMGFEPFGMGPGAPMGPPGSMGPGPPSQRPRFDAPPIRAPFGNAPLPGAGPGSNTKTLVNDYCQHFVDTGQRPQNFLRDSHLTDSGRYEEYPKLKELIMRKDELVANHATPPYYLKADLRQLKLSVDTFGTKFDVILIDPPWEEYARRAPGMLRDPETWTWQEIQSLEIENIADTPSFIFLWCGTAEGLDAGRHCLKKWGFRRCEDICWIKTNKDPNRKYLNAVHQGGNSVLTHTKEHCLMGIRGTVRRNQDAHVIHANCDTDVIVSEEPPLGSTAKPEEMYQIIERFCLGRRRLELFGEDNNIRPGWITVGRSLSTSNFNPNMYSGHFRMPDGHVYVENRTGGRLPPGHPVLLPQNEDIEALRPKSPPQHDRFGGGSRGRS